MVVVGQHKSQKNKDMNKQELLQYTNAEFQKQFSSNPEKCVLSPGRINLIGEHIDYNDGYVLPAAIDKYICFSVKPNDSQLIKVYASDLKEYFEINLSEKIKISDRLWENYFLGVVDRALAENKGSKGLDVVFSSNLPIGAGLSSSAALTCGFATILNHYFDLNWDKKTIALTGQWTEHHYVGVMCGIMDQFASVFGQENKAILLDCNSTEMKLYPTDFQEYTLVLFDSCVKHSLVASEYNQRRKEVNEGVEVIKTKYPQFDNFRNLTLEMIDEVKAELSEKQYLRLLFIVKEIARILKAVQSLEQNNFAEFGALVTQTHFGLSKEYEVSCPELDFLVGQTLQENGVLGSRMMGGGFGGCTITLVHQNHLIDLTEKIKTAYQKEFNIALKVYPVHVSQGTQMLDYAAI